MDESYELIIPSDGSPGADQRTDGVWRLYHALESLSQLVFFDTASEQFMLHGAPWSIEDAPAYPVILGDPLRRSTAAC